MDYDELRRVIQDGEGISVEFKRCGNQPGTDLFETVCSFANRQGGNIYLGVRDDGTIEGVSRQDSLPIRRNVINVVNNPKLFSSVPTLQFESIDCGEREVIRVWASGGALDA